MKSENVAAYATSEDFAGFVKASGNRTTFPSPQIWAYSLGSKAVGTIFDSQPLCVMV
jgi:hypothetical protein